MPGASGTSGARVGLATKIFLASTLLVVAVLGATFGVTSIQANRAADDSIQRALANTRARRYGLSGGAHAHARRAEPGVGGRSPVS